MVITELSNKEDEQISQTWNGEKKSIEKARSSRRKQYSYSSYIEQRESFPSFPPAP
jgi:hypothetical protein